MHKRMKFFIKDFFGKCDKIRSYLRIWSHLLKKSLTEKLHFLWVDLKAHTLTNTIFVTRT